MARGMLAEASNEGIALEAGCMPIEFWMMDYLTELVRDCKLRRVWMALLMTVVGLTDIPMARSPLSKRDCSWYLLNLAK